MVLGDPGALCQHPRSRVENTWLRDSWELKNVWYPQKECLLIPLPCRKLHKITSILFIAIFSITMSDLHSRDPSLFLLLHLSTLEQHTTWQSSHPYPHTARHSFFCVCNWINQSLANSLLPSVTAYCTLGLTENIKTAHRKCSEQGLPSKEQNIKIPQLLLQKNPPFIHSFITHVLIQNIS